ncbi:UNVERIFIED_CONTAM: Hydroxyproline O-galactosyltransferase HPGT1 [Sesamum radiatum]|uniref:Hexosyltransferase n=1 Tax=Sesamum radiatum TaxID=300843 RepID=A0AAW2TT10_SESRA
MGGRGSNHRLLSASSFQNRISFLMLSMFATMASLYVAGREQQKKLAALHVDLEQARQEGFVSKHLPENGGTTKKKLLAVIGIITMFGRKNNRDAIRKAWMPTGDALKKLEEEKGIVIRFVIGRSANHGDSSDREIDSENRQANDFTILENHMETPEERPKKTKLFLIHAVEHWDAEFYVKINDDVYVNIDALGAVLASHLDKPRAYIGCMKSGEVFSEPLVLHTYAHDDVSVGSWFIGLDVKHVDEGKFCCSSWSSGCRYMFIPI